MQREERNSKNMITFEKTNTLQARIKHNGKRIGILEKTIGGYIVEIDYQTHFYPEELKEKLTKHINTLYGYSQGYLSLGEILRK